MQAASEPHGCPGEPTQEEKQHRSELRPIPAPFSRFLTRIGYSADILMNYNDRQRMLNASLTTVHDVGVDALVKRTLLWKSDDVLAICCCPQRELDALLSRLTAEEAAELRELIAENHDLRKRIAPVLAMTPDSTAISTSGAHCSCTVALMLLLNARFPLVAPACELT